MSGICEDYWNKVYHEKPSERLSWHQDSPQPSLDVIAQFEIDPSRSVIDIGGGISPLVDALLDRGWHDVSVLDISATAIAAAQARLGAKASSVHWHIANVAQWNPARTYDVWHDRAVFHFLTEASDRAAYRDALRKGLAAGGMMIIATFAPDGPEKCSGLPVRRYDAAGLSDELGAGFTLLKDWQADHATPWGDNQSFQWCVFQKQ